MNNKVVFLTGGNRGIGRATAILLAEHGYRVVIAARDSTALEAVTREIQSRQGRCIAVNMDLTDPASIKQAIQVAIRHFDRIDVLINNAGILYYGPIANTPPESWQKVIATNLSAPFLCIQEVLPVMQAQGHGHIINITSHAGLYAFPNLGAYSASKFGLIGLSQSLGRELHNTGIKVSYVCPGAVNTEMLDAFPDEVVEPMQRDRPEQVAQCIYNTINYNNTRRRLPRILEKIIRRILPRHNQSQIEVWHSWVNSIFLFVFIPIQTLLITDLVLL